jgi:hypothetical protein
MQGRILRGFELLIVGALGSVAVLEAQGTEYTIQQIERGVNADGSERFRFERETVRRRDGSMAVHEVRHYRADGTPIELPFYSIYDVKGAVLTSIYPRVGAKITSKLNEAVRLRLSQVNSDCRRDGFSLEARGETMASIEVQLRTKIEDGTDRIVEKEWVAPSLGCLVMQKEVAVHNADGTLRGTVFTDLIAVRPGAPAEQRFVVPENLSEMSPSQVMVAQQRQDGVSCKACEMRSIDNADRLYLANRP